MKKKRVLKKWVKVTLAILIVYSVGLICVLGISARAEQITKAQVSEVR